jgi:rhodanese-related sulfurtransferase
MSRFIALPILLALASAAFSGEPKNVSPDEAQKLIKERKEILIIDVRTKEEFAAGHIPGAKNISILDDDFAAKLKAHEGKPVLVHCAAGNRSTRAVQQMIEGAKFPEIFHLDDGFKAWSEAGKPVSKSSPESKAEQK